MDGQLAIPMCSHLKSDSLNLLRFLPRLYRVESSVGCADRPNPSIKDKMAPIHECVTGQKRIKKGITACLHQLLLYPFELRERIIVGFPQVHH